MAAACKDFSQRRHAISIPCNFARNRMFRNLSIARETFLDYIFSNVFSVIAFILASQTIKANIVSVTGISCRRALPLFHFHFHILWVPRDPTPPSYNYRRAACAFFSRFQLATSSDACACWLCVFHQTARFPVSSAIR